MTATVNDLPAVRDAFTAELTLATEGKPSSLAFIQHTLPDTPLVNEHETFQVLVIGGSVFRKALVKNEKDHPSMLSFSEVSLPHFRLKEDFLRFIQEHIDSTVNTVAINFAYPLTPVFADNKLDGILISGTKEHMFTGLIGQHIGKTLERFIRQTLHKSIRISVANDAICLLLAGSHLAPKEKLSAIVMGTGTNMTFFHNGYAINLESANFDKFVPSNECLAIDQQSTAPGTSLFEKEIAGAYLFEHFNILLKKQHIAYSPIFSTKELKTVALSADIPRVKDLALDLITRSAGLLAAQTAGLAKFKNNDITVVIEGSFFWNNNIYKKAFEDHLAVLAPNHTIHITRVANSPILGGAYLVI